LARTRDNSGAGPTKAGAVALAQAQALARALAQAADAKKCEDITILDLRGVSSVADYFLIATAQNPRQQKAAAEAMRETAAALGRRPYGREGGGAESRWTLLDYVDVVAHIFDPEWRELYDLELLWGDAPRLEWTPAPKPPETQPENDGLPPER